MFSKRVAASAAIRKADDVKKSAAKVVDPKRDTQTRAKHLRLFLDNAELCEVVPFFEAYYSHIFYIVYDAFIAAEINLRQKGAHKAQREELESVLYLFEKILIYLPEHLARKWQYHSVGRLMSKLLHPGNSWKLLKREAMRLFLLWYQILGDIAGEPLHALFATLVPGFPSPYQGLGLTALAAMTPDHTQDGPINPAEICPLIPPQSGERWRSPDTDLTRIFLDVLLELMVSQVTLIEWKDNKLERQRRCLNFLFEKFKTFYMPHIFPEFNWSMSVYRPSLELPEVRKFRPAFVDVGDGTKKMDPMLSCRVVVIKWVAQYTHLTRNSASSVSTATLNTSGSSALDAPEPSHQHLNGSDKDVVFNSSMMTLSPYDDSTRNSLEGDLVRGILYGCRDNVDFVHEVYRQAFLLSFSHSPAIKKVISVYKDWIQLNVPELPPFLLEPLTVDKGREDFMNAMHGKPLVSDTFDSGAYGVNSIRAGLQNVLQIFITNAANVFLLEVSPEYPILLEEQVEMCKRVLNIYRYMVMNVKMEARTWEQLLFILLQITQLTLPEAPPRRREDTLGGRLAQAIFQTLIVTWIKANLYVVVSTELWDQFLEVLSSLTLWEELIREWAKTMETLTRVLARQVYHLDLNDLPLDRLSERASKKRRGRQAPQEPKYSSAIKVSGGDTGTGSTQAPTSALDDGSGAGSIVGPSMNHQHPNRTSPFPMRARMSSETEYKGASPATPRSARPDHVRRSKKVVLRRTQSEGNLNRTLWQLRRSVDDSRRILLEGHGRRRRWKSADSMQLYSSYEGEGSRSSSPAPSSGIECTSMKDSPMQLDHDTISEGGLSADHGSGGHHHAHHGHHHGHHLLHHQPGSAGAAHASSGVLSDSSSTSGHSSEPRSVMSGGSVKGWLPDVAVVLWRRMLGALGNINHIADTVIHAQIYKYLIELFEIMVKIRNNQGVSVDNACTPAPPDYVPPFTIFAPWCFRALSLPETYHRGRLYALRLLCLFTCRQHDAPLPKTHLVQFYKVLHSGLTGQKTDMMNTLIRFTGPRFFSLMLPGYTAYILDYLYAANFIISTSDLKGVPRTEATSVVGALLAFPSILPDIPLLLPNASELSLISSADVKDQIIGVLLKSGKKEPAGLARCISLSSLGIFVYSELLHGTFHPKIKEAIQVLTTALRFNNKAVAQIASDMLLLLTDHVKSFLDYYPEVPKRIIEVLARTLITLTPRGEAQMTEDEKRLLLSLLFCLGEWCMRIPCHVLTQTNEDGRTLLHHVFGALQGASDPGGITTSPVAPEVRTNRGETASTPSGAPKTMLSPAVMVDFDPNIHVDNTKEGYLSNNSSPLKSAKARSGSKENLADDSHSGSSAPSTRLILNLNTEESGQQPIRLAARTVLSHLVNYLFHFPMNLGAAGLSSMVSEQDDHPTIESDELSMEVFKANNIQFFILNNSTLLSFVELPNVDASISDIKTARSQVRVILRDISGKFAWDTCALYGPPSDLDEDTACDISSLWPEIPSVEVYGKNRLSVSDSAGQAMQRRSEHILPEVKNTVDGMDNLDDLLQYLGHTSPECLEDPGRPLNAVPMSNLLNEEAEKDVITGVLNQRSLETEFLHRKIQEESHRGRLELPPEANDCCGTGFHQCRRLFHQLGLASWEQRPNIHLVKKSERMLRELKNLDSKRCREAHKIAVIYVAEGQEDKQSILSNSSGSQAYEEFVSGLAWEVELETHAGFMGGLQKSKTTGETAPYYATSFVEVMFHVSTRMPTTSEQSMLQKTRHIGNDEVHIVWSEHWRDYRRGILPTEFCDVLIVIYPLKNRLFRIQVSRKPDVPYFGPLFNEMIVDARVLPGLVRATAINASRAKRSMLQYFQTHYEERHMALENIIKNHRDANTFEDFITSVYSPAPLTNLFQPTNSSSRPVSLVAGSSLGAGQLSTSSNALLDPHSPHTPLNFSATTSATELQQHHRRSRAPLLPSPSVNLNVLSHFGGGSGEGNAVSDSAEAPEVSPKLHTQKKLLFRTSTAATSSGAGATGSAAQPMTAKRPLSIKEETGLPENAVPPIVPTRKR